jgi:hypothetical protein
MTTACLEHIKSLLALLRCLTGLEKEYLMLLHLIRDRLPARIPAAILPSNNPQALLCSLYWA